VEEAVEEAAVGQLVVGGCVRAFDGLQPQSNGVEKSPV